jgi:hypothetical protein
MLRLHYTRIPWLISRVCVPLPLIWAPVNVCGVHAAADAEFGNLCRSAYTMKFQVVRPSSCLILWRRSDYFETQPLCDGFAIFSVYGSQFLSPYTRSWNSESYSPGRWWMNSTACDSMPGKGEKGDAARLSWRRSRDIC